MTGVRIVLAVLLIAAGGAGCESDPTLANERNFRKVIEAHLKSRPLYHESTVKKPLPIIGRENGYGNIMTELVKVGYAKHNKGGFVEYEVLRKAAPLVVHDDWGTGAVLRFGMADSVLDIVRFSTPQSFGPYLITEVEYTVKWEPTHLMTLPKFQALRDACGATSIDRVRRELTEVTTQTIDLAQFSDGWRAEF